MARIGIGYDVHQLEDGAPLVLGGVKIPFEKGLTGHSDADVLCHAIADALLGAAALGDIGTHFPDTDPKWKNVSSLLLLKNVKNLLDDRQYKISNIDAVVMAEKPKLKSYISEMIEQIADTLQVHFSKISIKATTTERLGFVGEEKGMAAQAVAAIVSAE